MNTITQLEKIAVPTFCSPLISSGLRVNVTKSISALFLGLTSYSIIKENNIVEFSAGIVSIISFLNFQSFRSVFKCFLNDAYDSFSIILNKQVKNSPKI